MTQPENPRPLLMDHGFVWPSVILLGLPVLCGLIFIFYTFATAKHNVEVWRNEFQIEINQQCPHINTNIVGGEGRVYLDAYLMQYEWDGDGINCYSNGTTTNCTCRDDAGLIELEPIPPETTNK